MTPRKATNTNKEILDAVNKLDEKINVILYGSAEGNTPGIMERLRKLEDWVASEKRLMYLIIAIILTDIVTRLWGLIVQ